MSGNGWIGAVVVLAGMLTESVLAQETGPQSPAVNYYITAPNIPFSTLTVGIERTLVITADGIVKNSAGIPLDELPPAEQIETMCGALASMSKAYGVEVRRCGKP